MHVGIITSKSNIHNLIDFIATIVGEPDRQTLSELQPSRVASLNDNDARGVLIVPTVRKLQIVHAHRCMVEAETEHLEELVDPSYIVDVEVDNLTDARAAQVGQPLKEHVVMNPEKRRLYLRTYNRRKFQLTSYFSIVLNLDLQWMLLLLLL